MVGEGRRWAGRPSVGTPWAEVVGEEGGGWTCRAEVAGAEMAEEEEQFLVARSPETRPVAH